MQPGPSSESASSAASYLQLEGHLLTFPSQGVFTYLVDNLGAKGIQFEELISLDAGALAELQPVYGVIFLFKFPTDSPYSAGDRPLDGAFDPEAADRIFFATQTIQNA